MSAPQTQINITTQDKTGYSHNVPRTNALISQTCCPLTLEFIFFIYPDLRFEVVQNIKTGLNWDSTHPMVVCPLSKFVVISSVAITDFQKCAPTNTAQQEGSGILNNVHLTTLFGSKLRT